MQYHRDGYQSCYADSSQPGIIRDLQDGSQATGRPSVDIYPVVFREELADMVQETVKAVRAARVLIHPEFADIIQQLKSVQYDRRGNPDKSTYTMDLFDAFMMAVSHTQGRRLYIADITSYGPGERPAGRSTNNDSRPGGITFAFACEVCGRQVETREPTAEWVNATCCPEHQAARTRKA